MGSIQSLLLTPSLCFVEETDAIKTSCKLLGMEEPEAVPLEQQIRSYAARGRNTIWVHERYSIAQGSRLKRQRSVSNVANWTGTEKRDKLRVFGCKNRFRLAQRRGEPMSITKQSSFDRALYNQAAMGAYYTDPWHCEQIRNLWNFQKVKKSQSWNRPSVMQEQESCYGQRGQS